MKLIRKMHGLMLATTIFLGSSVAWAAGPGCEAADDAAAALLCKQDQCPELNQANAKGLTPDEVYYSYCSSYGIEIRSRLRDATVENVIFELERTRYPNPPTLVPPCSCLAMLKDAFGACELEQCRSPEQPKSESPQSPQADNSQLQGGCRLQSSAGTPHLSLWILGLGLLLLSRLGKLRASLQKLEGCGN